MGLFSSIGDILSTPTKLFEGDFDGLLTAPFETAIDFDFIPFVEFDLGDLASEIDNFLDANPWLKGVIVAAGFAAGGVGGLVAAAAIAATDTISEVNEGTFDIGDLGRGAVEFGSLYAGGALAAGAGSMALNTTLGQVQAGTQILAKTGVLGDAGKYFAVAGSLAAADWGSLPSSISNAANALRSTGELGEDGDNVMSALIAASSGDYGSLQTAVASGAQALRAANIDKDVNKVLDVASTVSSGNYDNAANVVNTVQAVVDDLDVLSAEEEAYLRTGGQLIRSGINNDTSGLISGSAAALNQVGVPRAYTGAAQTGAQLLLDKSGSDAIRDLKNL